MMPLNDGLGCFLGAPVPNPQLNSDLTSIFDKLQNAIARFPRPRITRFAVICHLYIDP
jgi:hypothetical protein